MSNGTGFAFPRSSKFIYSGVFMKTIHRAFASVSAALALVLAACGTSNNAASEGVGDADTLSSGGFTQTGDASYYGRGGDVPRDARTANGEKFIPSGLTAAHKTLRFGTCVLVTNLNNNKSVRVRINDRGPYVHGRIIDLAFGAAKVIGLDQSGHAPVRISSVSCTGDANASSKLPSVDGQNCKVFLSLGAKSENSLTVTVQSRPSSGEERPCGKTVKIVGSGSATQAKELSSLSVPAGTGRLTAQIPLDSLEGISHLFAQVEDSQSVNRGTSEAKQLQPATAAL
jgi:rare lipoprotein A (peptidoglycan hydrolase)